MDCRFLTQVLSEDDLRGEPTGYSAQGTTHLFFVNQHEPSPNLSLDYPSPSKTPYPLPCDGSGGRGICPDKTAM